MYSVRGRVKPRGGVRNDPRKGRRPLPKATTDAPTPVGAVENRSEGLAGVGDGEERGEAYEVGG